MRKIETLLPAPAIKGAVEPGEPDEQTEAAIELIEAEVMKRGTLTADTLDWRAVQSEAIGVLGRCAHIAAVRGLVLARCQLAPGGQDLAVTLAFVLRFLRYYWGVVHPAGARQERRRKFMAGDVLVALAQCLTETNRAERGLPAQTAELAGEVLAEGKAAGLDVADFATAVVRLRDREAHSTAEPAPKAASPAHSVSQAELDARGRAELRRDIRTLAARIARHEPKAEVAFAMRRYAAWLEFQAPPPSDENARIEQQPMPLAIADEFRAALSQPSEAALLRLEDRLFTMPDWFEGQKYAADMARALGFERAADVIRDQVAQRLEALPELTQLQYANGTAIVPKDVAEWASATRAEPNPGRKEKTPAPEVPQAKDLKEQLEGLDREIGSHSSLRAQALAKYALAQVLAEEGLKAQAGILLQELARLFENETLSVWDSDLSRQVSDALKKVMAR